MTTAAKYAAVSYELPDGTQVRCASRYQFALILAASGRRPVVLKRSDSMETIARDRRRYGVRDGQAFYRGDRASGSVIELDGQGEAAASASYYVKRWTWTDCFLGSTPGSCLHTPRCGPHPSYPGTVGRVVYGWVGPVRSGRQALREVAAWMSGGQRARAYLATPARKREVDAWQAEADRRHGRRRRAS